VAANFAALLDTSV